MHKLFTDGGSRGNPGKSAAAFYIFKDDEVLTSGGEYLKINTNNYAEYIGLILGLKEALKQNIAQLEVFMDSELIIKQINGQYKVSSIDLKPLHAEVKSLCGKFTKTTFKHIPRAENKLADKLVNLILDQH